MLGLFWYYGILFTLVTVKTCSGNDIKGECVETCGTTEEVIKKFNPKVDSASDEVLCYEKCHFTKSGFLEEDGTVLVDSMLTDLKKMDMPQVDVDKFGECLKGIPKIVENKDMQLMLDCFQN